MLTGEHTKQSCVTSTRVKIKKASTQVTLQPLDSENNHLNNINTTRDVILSIHLTALRYKRSDTNQNIMNQSKIR